MLLIFNKSAIQIVEKAYVNYKSVGKWSLWFSGYLQSEPYIAPITVKVGGNFDALVWRFALCV